MDLQTAYVSRSPAQVSFTACVTSEPHYFYGRNTHAEHEAFNVQTPSGPVEIVDNVGIAPCVPVQPGERIDVCGEMVHDPGRPPVVHWTHHDPSGRHPDGFIRARGRIYA